MLISEAFKAWTDEIRPHVVAQYGENDGPALSEDWNAYTDMLCEDGALTGLQYHYCPAHDDDMPSDEDEERDYILDQLGVTISSTQTQGRADGAEWGEDATHWSVTVSRGEESLVVPFSMGAALTGQPQRTDVLHCLLMDWQSIEAADDVEEWAEETGADPDSRSAEATYERTREASEAFERLFGDISMDDLAELFADY